ncbi:MAG: helix-turn-helix domain-containing protein [Candidatus Bathyarchaeia archaeon]|jgi:DNA-binding transcriptional ArsR family regulator
MVDKSNGPSDIDRLEQEVAKLRDEVQRISSAIPPQNTQGNESPKRNFAQSLADYVNDVVESVTSGISSEIEKSVFVDPTGAWFDRHIARVQARSITPAEAERAATLMSAMASEHRLRILNELLYGGRYASEMEAVLKDLSPSTISNHLKILQESGLVVQEGDRGRYLVTLPGRIALKMATRLTRFLERRKS